MRMKYDVMRGDSLHPLFATPPSLPPSPTTASHDFEVLHVVDCGVRGEREGRKIDSAAPVFYHHFRVLGEGKRHALTPPPRQKPPKPKPAAEALPSSS